MRPAQLAEEVARRLARLEGKKSQVKMGDCREIVGIVSDLIFKDETRPWSKGGGKMVFSLFKNGERRAIKKIGKKKRRTKK